MSRKFDQPFVEISCWLPLSWLSAWQWLHQHPACWHAILKQWVDETTTAEETRRG